MTKAELINEIKNRIGFDTDNETYAMSKDERDFYTSILKILEQKSCDDTVSRGVFEQVMWERDTAIEQLRKLGYELGQKIEPCDDCVSRKEAIHCVTETELYNETFAEAKMRIAELKPVLPKRESEDT